MIKGIICLIEYPQRGTAWQQPDQTQNHGNNQEFKIVFDFRAGKP